MSEQNTNQPELTEEEAAAAVKEKMVDLGKTMGKAGLVAAIGAGATWLYQNNETVKGVVDSGLGALGIKVGDIVPGAPAPEAETEAATPLPEGEPAAEPGGNGGSKQPETAQP